MQGDMSMKRFSAVATMRTILMALGLFGMTWPVVPGLWCAGKPPAIEFLSPREGQTASGEIAIEARVGNPYGVNFVEFYIQEPGAQDRYGWKEYGPPPYVWGGKGFKLDTRLFADGPASVVLFCYTGGQKPAAEKRVNFTIDNSKPKIRIVSPADKSTVDGAFHLQVEVSDPKSKRGHQGIAAVSVYVDGALVHRMVKAPFRTSIDTCLMAPGLHGIRVVAEDGNGMAAADSVMVNLKSGSGLWGARSP
jgi:Bacterial Ig domain